MAGLRDSLSNPKRPLETALKLCEEQRTSNPKRRRYNTTKQIIAQAGATDPTTVHLHVKENHKLSATEVELLVQANSTGTTQRELAQQFHVSLETVNRHVRRRRQAVKAGRTVISLLIPVGEVTRGTPPKKPR